MNKFKISRTVMTLAAVLAGAAAVFAANGSFRQQARLTQPGLISYGQSVRVRGDTAAVSSAAGMFVYERVGGVWAYKTVLIPSDGFSGCPYFNNRPAMWGDTIVLGCPGQVINGVGQGALYVFERVNGTWTETHRLLASDGQLAYGFGGNVELNGDTIIAGSEYAAINGESSGAAYVFVRTPDGWREQARLTPADPLSYTHFGRHVALDSDTAMVSNDRSAVYFFVRQGETWRQQQRLSDCTNSSVCNFGSALAIRGDMAMIGDQFMDANGISASGGVHVYRRSANVWSEVQLLSEPDGVHDDYFGVSLEFDERTAVIGSDPATRQGRAFLFSRFRTRWLPTQIIESPVPAYSFSRWVALDGLTAIVSAAGEQAGEFLYGAVRIYTRSSGSKAFDFDGDLRADLSVYRPSSGTWFINRSAAGFASYRFGIETDRIAPADLDGDGRTDVAVFRPATGIWYWLSSSEGTFNSVQFGSAGDMPVPADYDGDGMADISVFRPSDGFWYRINSRDRSTSAIPFGVSEDRPTPGDYDGDGKADIAVYRPSSGVWYIQRTNLGYVQWQFGISEDRQVPADYDGDGKVDIAVYRPSTGMWYLSRSSQGVTAFQFGLSSDKPAPADYDGDGKADIVVYRPSTGVWYLQQSTGGYTGVQFGLSADQPIANSFVR